MIRINANEVERHIVDILERVDADGESYEIARDNKIIARIEPVHSKRFTVGDFRKWWNDPNRVRLDPEDAAQWERDQIEIRASAKLPPSPWD